MTDIEKAYLVGFDRFTLYVSCESLELGTDREVFRQVLKDLSPIRLNQEEGALKRLNDEVTTIMADQGYAKAREHYDRQASPLGKSSARAAACFFNRFFIWPWLI